MAEQYLGANKVSAKDLYAQDATAFLSKNLLQYPADAYLDAQKQMAPINPLWWMYTLVQSNMRLTLPDFVSDRIIFDEKFYLRSGAVHTEVGHTYPHVLKDSDIPKPGQALTTPRAQYLRIIQEESGKETIHLRTHLDQRVFDHAEKFYEFSNYMSVMGYYIQALTYANNLFFRTLVAAQLLALSGGAVLFDEGTDLERFFQPTGKDLQPTEAFSKVAREYYSNDGEVKKYIKQEAGRIFGNMKNRAVYDPTLVIDEINAKKVEIKEYKFPDISDLSKLKQWLKSMYTDTSGGKTTTTEESRRKCLWGLLNAIDYKIERMTTTDSVYNWMGFDPGRTGSLDDVYDISMMVKKSDLIVYMNSEDLNAARVAVGGLEIGMFAAVPNGTIQRRESEGVRFRGVPYMLPGTYAIVPDWWMQIIMFFDQFYNERFDFHLVKNWIRHTMCRVVAFKNIPGHFGAMKVFQPDPAWLVKHYKFWK